MAYENVVAASLRMRNTAVRTARDLKHEVRDVGREAQRMGTKFGHAVKASRTSVAGLAGSFVSLRTIIAATFAYRAIQKFGRFLGSLSTLYKQQEDSLQILGESLAGWNNYSKEMVAQLHEQAMAMQHVVNVDNEEIESMMALLATYGMTGDEISKVIGLTIDFAKAKRIELKAAVDLVGKAFVGYTGTLSRYGIILDRNLSKEEKYAAMLEAIGAYEGVAAGMAETYSGTLGVLSKAYDDMKKQMGAVIAKGIEQSGILDSLSAAVENITNWFIKWEPVLVNFTEGALENFKNKLIDLAVTMEEGNLPRWLFTVGNAFQIVGKLISYYSGAIAEGLSYIVQVFIMMSKVKAATWALLTKGPSAYLKKLKEVEDYQNKMFDNAFKQGRRRERIAEETMKGIKKDIDDLKFMWEAPSGKDFLTRLGEKLESVRVRLEQERQVRDRLNEAMGKGIQNRGKLNEELRETIKLTEAMARQYALASRVEQEQIKFLLAKAGDMTPEDVLGLTEMEKKLITSQNVLKERYKDLFSVFSTQELGIELEDKKAFERIGEELMNIDQRFVYKPTVDVEPQVDALIIKPTVDVEPDVETRTIRPDFKVEDTTISGVVRPEFDTDYSKVTDMLEANRVKIEEQNDLYAKQYKIAKAISEATGRDISEQQVWELAKQVVEEKLTTLEIAKKITAEKRSEVDLMRKELVIAKEIKREKEESLDISLPSPFNIHRISRDEKPKDLTGLSWVDRQMERHLDYKPLIGPSIRIELSEEAKKLIDIGRDVFRRTPLGEYLSKKNYERAG